MYTHSHRSSDADMQYQAARSLADLAMTQDQRVCILQGMYTYIYIYIDIHVYMYVCVCV